MDFSVPRFILEYGPGTGVYTRYLLNLMKEGSRLHVFELNGDFVQKLKTIDNKMLTIHHRSAEAITEVLGRDQKGKIDYIISGIPFSFLEDTVRNSILNQSYHYLKSGGLFLAYQTSDHLKEPLHTHFDELSMEFELLNIPPMMVYRAVKHP